MSVLKQITMVQALLIKYPRLRDNDQELLSLYYLNHLGLDRVAQMTALDFLEALERGDLPSFESVTRSRRRVQEDSPDLRGERWHERHQTEEKVREEVRR